MDKSVEILKKIYQNAKVGVNTSNALIDRLSSTDVIDILSYQCEKYMEIAKRAADLLAEKKILPPDIGFTEKMGLMLSVELNRSCSEGKAAEVIMNACTSGLMEMTKLVNSGKCDRCAASLAEVLADTEQKSMYFMRRYLGKS